MTSLTLAHRRDIDRAKEDLVKAAEELLEKAQVTTIKKSDFGHSQLRNLVAVALETESPAVVTNFIRYQMGKDKSGKSWSKKSGDKTLGVRLIDEIDKGAVHRAVETVQDAKQDAKLAQLARIELIRHFLGFMSRHLRFLDLQRTGEEHGNGGAE